MEWQRFNSQKHYDEAKISIALDKGGIFMITIFAPKHNLQAST